MALASLEGSSLAAMLRVSRWGYAAVNATHIFGIALLVGTTMPLNLRMLGLWPDVPQQTLMRVLVPLAASGLAIAMTAGFLLFSVRAGEYADLRVFQIKLALILVGTLSVLRFHLKHGLAVAACSNAGCWRHAIISMICWIGALICGRLIAFVGD